MTHDSTIGQHNQNQTNGSAIGTKTYSNAVPWVDIDPRTYPEALWVQLLHIRWSTASTWVQIDQGMDHGADVHSNRPKNGPFFQGEHFVTLCSSGWWVLLLAPPPEVQTLLSSILPPIVFGKVASTFILVILTWVASTLPPVVLATQGASVFALHDARLKSEHF